MPAAKKGQTHKKLDNITKIGISALLIILVESMVLTIIVLKQQNNSDNKVVNAQTGDYSPSR